MKKLLTIAALLLAHAAGAQTSGQQVDTSAGLSGNLYNAGVHLEKYCNTQTLGNVFGLIGAGMAIGGALQSVNDAANDTNVGKGLVIAGGATACLGYIIRFAGLSHAGKAGKYLQAGGLSIPIGGKRSLTGSK